MVGLGGVRITDYTSRRQEYETYRMVARINPFHRQWRTLAFFVLAFIVVALVADARSGDLSPGHMAVFGLVAVIGALLASDRVWAWRAAGRFMRNSPVGPWHLGVDADGITCAVDGYASAYDWPAIVHVVEGKAAIVFAQNVSRYGVAWVSVPGARLSPEDRAGIRAWAQAAPGEPPRPWTTVSGVATPPADADVVRSRLGAAAAASAAMDGLGGVFATVVPTRDTVYVASRMAAKVQPGRRWSRPLAWLFVLSMSALAVMGVAGGEAAPIAWVLLAVGAGAWAWIDLATDRAILSERVWARRWSQRWPPAAGPSVRVRFDVDGLSMAAGGLFRSYDWSRFIQIVEGDSAIVFVEAANFRGVTSWATPAEDLSSEDRARIRKWAQAAPGERKWISYRATVPD